jgi:hypothetical protein
MQFPSLLIFAAVSLCSFGADQPAKGEPNAQLRLGIRLFEIKSAQQKAVGFDWHMGNVLQSANSNAAQGVFPAPPTGEPGEATPSALSAGTLSGILSDPQFRTVIRALEAREGAVPVVSAEAPATSGVPVKLQRPDGWRITVLPRIKGDEIELEFELAQTKGEHAGFSVSSRTTVKSGESAIFSDWLNEEEKKKKSGAPHGKRLLFFLEPRLEK